MLPTESNHLIRNILIVIVFSFFVGVAVYVSLFVQGKRISTEGQIELTDTGTIQIEVEPEDAEIYINGERKDDGDSTISGVEFGAVDVEIVAEGFSSWKNSFVLDDKRIKKFDVLLLPTALETDRIARDLLVDKVFFTGDAKKILFTVTNAESPEMNGIWEIDLDRNILDINYTEEPKQLVTFQNDLLSELKNGYNLEISGDLLILDIEVSAKIYQIDQGEESITDLTQAIGFYPERFQIFNNGENLIIQDGNLLIDLSLNDNQKRIIYYDPEIEPQYVVGQESVFLSSIEKPYEIDIYKDGDTKLREVKIDMYVENPRYIAELNNSEGQILLIQSDSGLYYYNLDTDDFGEIYNGENSLVSVSSNHETLLIQSQNDVSLVYEFDSTSSSEDTKIQTLKADFINTPKFAAVTSNIFSIITDETTSSVRITDKDSGYIKNFNFEAEVIDFAISHDKNELFFVVQREGEVELRSYEY